MTLAQKSLWLCSQESLFQTGKMPKHNQRSGGGGGVGACLFKRARKFVPKDHRAAETAGRIGAGALISMPVRPLTQREHR